MTLRSRKPWLSPAENPEVMRISARPTPPPAPVKSSFDSLTPVQRSLFGPNGAQTWSKLSKDNREVFVLLTGRLAANGVDLTGLRLKKPLETIRRNRLLFENDPVALGKLKAQLQGEIKEGSFVKDSVFPLFHWGMSDFGVREDRKNWTMQLGMGSNGAFVDMDRFNFKRGLDAFIGHTAELIHPGRPDPADIMEKLGMPKLPAFF